MELGSRGTDFHEIYIGYCQEKSCLVKIGQKQQTFHTKTYVNLRYLSFLGSEKFQVKL
jgi:hypothetical protein